jgi:hypothetical protein
VALEGQARLFELSREVNHRHLELERAKEILAEVFEARPARWRRWYKGGWRKEGGFWLELKEMLVIAIAPAFLFHRVLGFIHMHKTRRSRFETSRIALSDLSLLE